jgi:hypothetical protein
MLDFFFRDQRPPGWRHWAEVVWRDPATPKFIGDMPHTWVASDFVRSAIDLFAYERESDSSMVVGAGVLPEWLGGDGVRVRGMGTHYGTLRLEMRWRGGEVDATVDLAGGRMPPGGIALRAPVGTVIATARDASGPLAVDDGVVRLRERASRVTLALRPAERR